MYYDHFPFRYQISQQSYHHRVFNVYRYTTVSYCKINNQYAISCAEFDFSEQVQFRNFVPFQQEIVKRRKVFLLKLVRNLGLWELENTGRLFCKAGRFKGAKSIRLCGDSVRCNREIPRILKNQDRPCHCDRGFIYIEDSVVSRHLAKARIEKIVRSWQPDRLSGQHIL